MNQENSPEPTPGFSEPDSTAFASPSETTVPQTPELLPPKKSRKKLLAALLLVLLIFIAAGTYYAFVRNNSSDSGSRDAASESEQKELSQVAESGRLEYTDEVGRFSVQYPKDWVVEIDSDSSGDDTKYAELISPNGLKIELASNLGGRGISDTCTYDELTGTSEWTDDSVTERCPYTKYHGSIQTQSQALDNNGQTQYVHIVDRSYTSFDEDGTQSSSYSVCAQLGGVTVGAIEYGPSFVDPEINTYFAGDKGLDRFVKACVGEFGTDESFLKREDVGLAREILATIRLL